MSTVRGPLAAEPVSQCAWYRGDCHVHSVHSNGGELAPERLAADARAMGLDFVATTEHNTAAAHEAWRRLGGDDLVVLLGQEVVTRAGHWLALGLHSGQTLGWDYVVDDAVIERHLAEAHRLGAVSVAAHPHAAYPTGTFRYPYRGFDVVEVWNGPWASDRPWQADNEAALAEWASSLAADVPHGRWRPAMGNSDTHLDGQLGIPHTVVAAEQLSANAILAGIRAGRSWVADSTAVELAFTVTAGERPAGIGESLDTDRGPAVAQLRVSGVPEGTVTFHTGEGAVHRAVLPAAGSAEVPWRTSAAESAFVRVEVRRPGGRMAALSNPIILV